MQFLTIDNYYKMSTLRNFLDYYSPYLANGFMRSREALLIRTEEIRQPSLDIGCGDGSFVKIGLKHKFNVGYDCSKNIIKKARNLGTYEDVVVGDIAKLSFPDETFNVVLANSVLEHVDNIGVILKEIGRILKRDGKLILTAPCSEYNNLFYLCRILHWFGINRVDLKKYHGWLNHRSLLSLDDWLRLIRDAKMSIKRYQYYTSPKAACFHTFVMDLHRLTLHPLVRSKYLKPPAVLIKLIYGKKFIKRTYLKISEVLFTKLYFKELNGKRKGSHLFIVAQKK